jgi:LPXTG-site transpeptidase (sortase) family protein
MTENICPYLGSLGDPLSCTTCATEDNLCFSTGDGDLITKPHQKKYCLSGKMTSCSQFPAESTLSTFSTTTASATASEPAARPKPSRQAPGRSSYRMPSRPVAEPAADEVDEYLASMPSGADRDLNAFSLGKDAGPEDAYFDAVGPLGDATPEDSYFDDLDKAAAASHAAERQPAHDEPVRPFGNTVLMDLNEVKGAKKGRPASGPTNGDVARGRPGPAPEVATPISASPARPQEKPAYTPATAPVEPPVKTPVMPPRATNGPVNAPSFSATATSASTADSSPTSLYDNTTVLPTVQRPPATETAKPDLGMPESAKPTAKPTRLEEKRPRKDYAGADPSWMARQIAEQAKPAGNGSLPENPRPPKPAPALVPNPARIKPPVAPAAPVAVQPFPEQLPIVTPSARRSRVLLYLSLSTGLLAVLLVCLGTLVLRGNVLVGGSNILAANGTTATVIATPAEMAAASLADQTSTALVDPTATVTPTAEPVTDPATAAAAPATAAPVIATSLPPTVAPATDTAVPTIASVATETPAPTATATPEPPTPTATATVAPSETLAPTSTASPVPSATAIGLIPTRPNPTYTPVPSPSSTPPTIASPTSVPMPTATPTSTATPMPAATQASVRTTVQTAAQTYAVQGGDTPYDIANRFDVTVADLLAANPGMNPRLMRIGQELTIPVGGAASPAATTTPDAPVATPTPVPVATYVIKGGDTVTSIAADLGVDRTDLLDANPGLDPRLLRIGQEIKVPTAGGPTPAAIAAVVSTTTAAASPPPALHVIKAGETLLGIAIQYDTTTEDLTAANPGIKLNLLQIGQEIVIPQVNGTTAPVASSASATNTTSSVPAAVEARLAPIRIVASSIKLDAPVVSIATRKDIQAGSIALMWDEPDSAVGFHADSTLPGQTGNVVLSGANSGKGEVFRNISDLKEGDEIQVYAADQSYRYQVQRVLMMPDKYISAEKRRANDAWLGQTSDTRLTLVSYGPYPTAAQRVVIIARPASAKP